MAAVEIIPSRVLNELYIFLDIGFLLFLLVTLLAAKNTWPFFLVWAAACFIFWWITAAFTCCSTPAP